MARICLWDIEATGLDADTGFMLSFGYKFLGESKAHVISVLDFPDAFKKDPTNDYFLVAKAALILSKADMWVFHYGKFYDMPYVNSKLLVHGLDVLPNTPYIDTWDVARKRLKIRGNSLKNISSFLGLEEKTPLTKRVWVRASAGHVPSINYVNEHCEQDVEVLEQAYTKLLPLMNHHASVPVMSWQKSGCKNCGSLKVQSRGYEVAKTVRYRRIQCTNCGKWDRGERLK